MKFSAKSSTLFISHGAPDLIIRETFAGNFFKELSNKFTKPSAIIVFSAHYETDNLEITGNLQLKTIHDFGGFPQELYKMHYDANGFPELALEIKNLFEEMNFSATINPKRGLDHGAWIPLKLIYPNADIPIIQISLQPLEDAIYQYKIGRIISHLKEKNILIIGSGSLTHNLAMAFQNKEKPTPIWVEKFIEAIYKTLQNQDIGSIINWYNLEYAQENHPSPEHFIPLLIALGAVGGEFRAERLHHSYDYSVLAMDCYVFSGNFLK